MVIARDTALDGTKVGTGSETTGTAYFANNGGSTTAGTAKLLKSYALLSTVFANVTAPSGWTVGWSIDLSTAFCVAMAYKENSAGTETGATWAMPGQPVGFVNIWVGQYSGVLTSSAIDKHPAGSAGGSQVNVFDTPASGVLAQADEVVGGAVGLSGVGTNPDVTTAGDLIANVGGLLFVSERIVAATTSVTETFDWDNNNFPVSGIDSFKAIVLTDVTPSMAIL